MSELAGLFRFFGAAIFIVLKFFMNKFFKGIMGLVIKAGLGIGLAVGASLVAPICPALGTIMVAAAIILGGIVGIVVLMIAQSVPFLGGMIVAVLEPFTTIMTILLILAILEFVFDIISTVGIIIPGINIILIIVSVAIPLIQLYLMWKPFGDAFALLPNCLGLGGESPSMAIPGMEGTYIGQKGLS